MSHLTQKNSKIKKLIINLESQCHETKKTDAWWSLGIRVQVQHEIKIMVKPIKPCDRIM
jgi:hypothetical protein